MQTLFYCFETFILVKTMTSPPGDEQETTGHCLGIRMFKMILLAEIYQTMKLFLSEIKKKVKISIVMVCSIASWCKFIIRVFYLLYLAVLFTSDFPQSVGNNGEKVVVFCKFEIFESIFFFLQKFVRITLIHWHRNNK